MMNNWFQVAQKNLAAAKFGHWNEASTRRLIIEPIFAAIGYEVWDANSPCRVDAESSIEGASQQGGKGKADYILFSSNVPIFAVEAKPIGMTLSDVDAKQLCDYCLYKDPPIKWGVLTNGNDWRLYDTHKVGSPDQKKVMQWSLANHFGALVVLLGPQKVKELIGLVSALVSVPAEKYRNVLLENEAVECGKQLLVPDDLSVSTLPSQGEVNSAAPSSQPMKVNSEPADMVLDPDSLPNLHFASVLEASINQLKASDWNALVRIGVKIAYSSGYQADGIGAITGLNVKPGSHTANGFQPVSGCPLSVQNVDANKAGSALVALAKKMGVPLLVRVRWQQKEKAAYPGKIGVLSVA